MFVDNYVKVRYKTSKCLIFIPHFDSADEYLEIYVMISLSNNTIAVKSKPAQI